MDIRQADGRLVTVEADAAERAALATRFGIIAIDRLIARIALDRHGESVAAAGTLEAAIVQSCAVSAEDLAIAIAEPLSFRFVPARHDYRPDQEIELDAEQLDEIEYDGTAFDLGEAIAQSLSLAIDPFATGPGADEARRTAGLVKAGESGPFAILAKLKHG